jgi:hypothetical protein
MRPWTAALFEAVRTRPAPTGRLQTGLRGTVNCVRAALMETPRVCPYRPFVATTYRIPTLSSRREYFRLPYPITSGATLAVDGANYKVGELSERGLRVVSGVGRFALDARVQGTLTLAMGLRCQVSGTVMRIEDDSFVLKLDRGPSSYDVIREQRFVAKTFPDWKPQPA